MQALVIKSTGSWYSVLPIAEGLATQGDGCCGDAVKARLRGSLRLDGATSTAPVVVGDVVTCVQNSSGEWVIDSVAERRNYLVRRATNLSRQRHIIGANIDRLYVVMSLEEPATPLEFVDRVLAAASAYGVEAKIVVNKVDIARPNDHFLSIYERAGYGLILTSTLTDEGMDTLRDDVRGKTVLFTGNSGVGKSSLINALERGAMVPTAKVGKISAYHQKGKHTTTFSEIFPLASGGYLIDTPGIKGFGLVDIDSRELYHHFVEIMAHSAGCAFSNCTHTHEPDCAVRQAVEQQLIARERYESYCKMMSENESKYR